LTPSRGIHTLTVWITVTRLDLNEVDPGTKEVVMAEAQLFRDANYKGGAVTVTEDVAKLSSKNFNDVTTSVIVKSGTFTLYQDDDFNGWSITVSAVGGPDSNGRYPNSSTLGGHNDKVSSVRKNSDNPT
jgi:hypothetical protein